MSPFSFFRTAIIVSALAACAALSGCVSVRAVHPPVDPATRRIAYQPDRLFSPVVRSGNLLFLSGVIGRDPNGPNGIEAETRRTLEKIRTRLALAGAGLEDIVKCQVLLDDIGNYEAMNRVYVEFFPNDPPARTAVAVKALPAQAVVEIDCIAAAR